MNLDKFLLSPSGWAYFPGNSVLFNLGLALKIWGTSLGPLEVPTGYQIEVLFDINGAPQTLATYPADEQEIYLSDLQRLADVLSNRRLS